MQQQSPQPAPAAAYDAAKTRKIFFIFLIAIAAVACLILALNLLRPHRTGTVVSVGRISSRTIHTGVGKNAREHNGYAANVKVRVKGSSEQVTVYYSGRLSDIPQEGDEVQFGSSLTGGYSPYPERWALELGLYMLGADLLVWLGYLFYRWRQQRRKAA